MNVGKTGHLMVSGNITVGNKVPTNPERKEPSEVMPNPDDEAGRNSLDNPAQTDPAAGNVSQTQVVPADVHRTHENYQPGRRNRHPSDDHSLPPGQQEEGEQSVFAEAVSQPEPSPEPTAPPESLVIPSAPPESLPPQACPSAPLPSLNTDTVDDDDDVTLLKTRYKQREDPDQTKVKTVDDASEGMNGSGDGMNDLIDGDSPSSLSNEQTTPKEVPVATSDPEARSNTESKDSKGSVRPKSAQANAPTPTNPAAENCREMQNAPAEGRHTFENYQPGRNRRQRDDDLPPGRPEEGGAGSNVDDAGDALPMKMPSREFMQVMSNTESDDSVGSSGPESSQANGDGHVITSPKDDTCSKEGETRANGDARGVITSATEENDNDDIDMAKMKNLKSRQQHEASL
jgi:hypothetical protein